jgi:hypothetical protein
VIPCSMGVKFCETELGGPSLVRGQAGVEAPEVADRDMLNVDSHDAEDISVCRYLYVMPDFPTAPVEIQSKLHTDNLL